MPPSATRNGTQPPALAALALRPRHNWPQTYSAPEVTASVAPLRPRQSYTSPFPKNMHFRHRFSGSPTRARPAWPLCAPRPTPRVCPQQGTGTSLRLDLYNVPYRLQCVLSGTAPWAFLKARQGRDYRWMRTRRLLRRSPQMIHGDQGSWLFVTTRKQFSCYDENQAGR